MKNPREKFFLHIILTPSSFFVALAFFSGEFFIPASYVGKKFILFTLFALIGIIPITASVYYIWSSKYRDKTPEYIVWKLTPLISMSVGIAVTISTLVREPGTTEPTSFMSLYDVITKASVGIVTSIITFIGISIWVFVEQMVVRRDLCGFDYCSWHVVRAAHFAI